MNQELFFNGYIERIANKFNLEKPFAFEILAIAAILDLSFDEVFALVSTIENGSGSHDGGFDGIYLEEDEEESALHIFQIKFSKNIGDNELSKFITDYQNLFVYGNTLELPLNSKVSAALQTYQALVVSGRVIDAQLHFVFNGEKNQQNQPIFDRHSQRTAALRIYDSSDLYHQIDSLVAVHKKRKPVTFSFMAEKSNIALPNNDPQTLISFSIQNVKAVSFRLPALALCELIDKEQQINKRTDTLFSENIRGFLRYNRTNKNIRETLLSNDAGYFPFLNNGITIIAERVNIPSNMQAGYYPLEVKNPVIVNGLQTTHVIYDIYQQDKARLNGVYVVVRLYETTDNALIDKITNATNTQSPINYRDKISARRFNDYTQEIFSNAGVGYLCKRGETFDNKLSVSLQKSVHSETVLKFWYATFFEQPERAKSAKSKVLEELFDATTNKNNPLHALFNGDKNSPIYQQLLEAFWIYDFVVTQRQTQQHATDFVLFSDELLSYGIYKLLKQKCGFNSARLPDAYQTVYQTIPICITREKTLKSKNHATYSHNSFFKSARSRFHLNEILELSEDAPF